MVLSDAGHQPPGGSVVGRSSRRRLVGVVLNPAHRRWGGAVDKKSSNPARDPWIRGRGHRIQQRGLRPERRGGTVVRRVAAGVVRRVAAGVGRRRWAWWQKEEGMRGRGACGGGRGCRWRWRKVGRGGGSSRRSGGRKWVHGGSAPAPGDRGRKKVGGVTCRWGQREAAPVGPG